MSVCVCFSFLIPFFFFSFLSFFLDLGFLFLFLENRNFDYFSNIAGVPSFFCLERKFSLLSIWVGWLRKWRKMKENRISVFIVFLVRKRKTYLNRVWLKSKISFSFSVSFLFLILKFEIEGKERIEILETVNFLLIFDFLTPTKLLG